jgi:hypothetical protein
MKRVIRRPSPAMVVAIVALIAALGGTAIAGGVINKKKAKNIANNVVTQRAPGLSVASAKTADNANALGGLPLRGLSQWAFISSSSSGGTVIGSSGGVSSTVLGAGRFRVHFPNSVANCALNVNGAIGPTSASDATNFAPAMVMAARSTTGPNDVQVETDGDAGTEVTTEPFFLGVQC